MNTTEFAVSYERLDEICGWLAGADATALTHAELEDELSARGRELLRTVFQDQLDRLARQARQSPMAVIDVDGEARRSVESGHHHP